MSAGKEIHQAQQWLYGKLTGGTALGALLAAGTLGVYDGDDVTDQTAAPYVVINWVSSVESQTANFTRVINELQFDVKAVYRGRSYATGANIMAEVDTLLHRSSGSVSGLCVLGCRREEPFQYAEVTEGISWRHYGASYTVQVENA